MQRKSKCLNDFWHEVMFFTCALVGWSVYTSAPQPDSNVFVGKERTCSKEPLALGLVCKSKTVKYLSEDGVFKKKKKKTFNDKFVFND